MIRFRYFLALSAVFCWLVAGLFLSLAQAATESFQYTAEFPYAIGARQDIRPGGSFQGRLCLLYTAAKPLTATVSLKLPHGVRAVNLPQGWNFAAGEETGELNFVREFGGGYENWFELLQFQTDANLPEGQAEILLNITTAEENLQETLRLNIGGQAVDAEAKIAISQILLPYDGEENSSVDNGVLLLRNSELDYYKNLILGQGALNDTNKTSRPLATMRLEWLNPELESKLVLLEIKLLDKYAKEPVPGLISPAGEDGETVGITAAEKKQPLILAELDGSLRQMMELPVYVDDEILKSGDYVLNVTAKENDTQLAQYQMPLKIIALDAHAALVTLLALILVLAALPYILSKKQLREMKSRNLITIALFGATAFAFVNVPGTFLQDISRILLGPFNFFISGMFSGILLYMLLGGLVVLIPKFGVVTLMLMARMLLNMFIFGHISPFAFLIYGSQAVLLELSLFCFGVRRAKIESQRFSLLLAASCGLADAVSTYILLQSFSFLYRLFYADWYILLCMLVSGFLYPAIGALCGVHLGRELKKVGVD